MLRSATDAGAVMNESVIACSACAQQALQPIEARLTSTRAASPRLNFRNDAGVLKPANPSSSANGKAPLPAAVRSVFASSRIALTCCQAASRDRNGAGAVGSAGISTGAPSVSRVTTIRYSDSARNVFAKPLTADFCVALNAALPSANPTRFTAFFMLRYHANQFPLAKPAGSRIRVLLGPASPIR